MEFETSEGLVRVEKVYDIGGDYPPYYRCYLIDEFDESFIGEYYSNTEEELIEDIKKDFEI